MADDSDNDLILEGLQHELVKRKGMNSMSTLVRQGNEKLVQDFLTDNIKVESAGPFAKKTQLYVASFWGIKESAQKLLEAGTNPNLQNFDSLWTPLHAAAFQEHGPIIMLLLEYGAQPELPDSEDRTAADFASASDKIWPFFAALDIDRTSRADLVRKGILRPGSGMEKVKDPGYGLNLAEYKPNRGRSNENGDNNYMAAMNGDVLADDDDMAMQNSRHGSQPQYSLWK